MKTPPEAAVASLRLRIKGHPIRQQDLPACRELAAAGIMEPISETEFRFTAWGMEHREEILERESDRIEAGRMPPPTVKLPDAARERLRRHLTGDDVVTAEDHPAYRELEAARVVFHTRPFVGGDSCRLTYWGYKLKGELTGRDDWHRLNGPSSSLPASGVPPSPRG